MIHESDRKEKHTKKKKQTRKKTKREHDTIDLRHVQTIRVTASLNFFHTFSKKNTHTYYYPTLISIFPQK